MSKNKKSPIHNPSSEEIAKKLEESKRRVAYLNQQVQYLKEHGIRVKGEVIRSEDIYDPVDRESGKKVAIRFKTLNNVEYTIEIQSWLHFPSNEKWHKYVEQRKVGREVEVIYRPDLDKMSKAELERMEDFMVDFGES